MRARITTLASWLKTDLKTSHVTFDRRETGEILHNSSNMAAEHRCSMAVSEMTESLQRVGEQPSELSVEERNLLSVTYGSTAGSRRAAWRIITGVEQKGYGAAGFAREGVCRDSGR